MGFEFNPADDDPHGECRYEIQRLKLLSSKCDGCGLPELHKMCPASGTAAYMNPEHEAWGSVDGIMDLKFGNKDAEIARLNAKLTALRNGIAEVVQVQGERAGEFLLWPLGHMHVNSESEMVGCSPAGAKLAKLWRESGE